MKPTCYLVFPDAEVWSQVLLLLALSKQCHQNFQNSKTQINFERSAMMLEFIKNICLE